MEKNNLKILAIDDNQDNLVSLKAILLDLLPDAKFLSANNGRKGIAMAIIEDPDVILLDIVMPGLDGYEVCQQLKEDEKLSMIPVVFLTAIKTGRDSQIKALEVGAEAFLAKPIDEMHLVATVRAMAKIKESHELMRKEQDRLSNLILSRTTELQKESDMRSRFETDLESANEKLRKSQAALLNILEDLRNQNIARKLSEEKYRLLFTQMTEGFALHEIICNNKGIPVDYRFVEVNHAFEVLTGLRAIDIIGKTVLEVMPATETRWISTYGKVAQTGKPIDFTQYNIELDRTYSVYAFSPRQNQFATILTDVSDQVRIEQALRESETKFRRITEQVSDLIFMTDRNGLLIYLSPASFRLFGYEPDEMLTEKFTTFLAESERKSSVKAFRLAMRTGSAIKMVIRMKRKDGTLFDGELRASIYRENGRVQGILGLIHDITERKRLTEELETSREQLQELNRYVLEAREEERTLISREIHDELGQSLSALKIDLGWVLKNCGTRPDLRQRLEEMINLVSNTISDVQRISSSLRPGILDDLGLSAACEWYCEEFERRTELQIEKEIEELTEGGVHENTALFRILQEGLTNVLRHAQADRIRVILKRSDAGIVLSVSDNGIGIPYEKMDSRNSLGILGMKERVRQLGGRMKITSAPFRGTKLNVTVPQSKK